jgi:dienelactone hydrolase
MSALFCIFTQVALAQSNDTDSILNESVQMVSKKGFFTIGLETTLYKPDGEGPFPLAILNHGKALGDPRFQGRYRPAIAARYFLQRGYAVVVPMRQGFSKSEGSYIGGGCNIESNGLVQAEDVKAALDYAVAQTWADKNKIVVIGQSHGGWTTLAFGTLNYPGVKALINFAGGLRQDNCAAWESGLARVAASYARQTRVPSLWFYGDNDSYFSPNTYRTMFEQYTAAGGKARLVDFGHFGNDAHSMFGSRSGVPIWQPEVSRLLASVGLPNEPLAAYHSFATVALMDTPPRTDFAPLDDETKLPYVRDTGRAGYKTYLTREIPRAFAIAPNGIWGWANGGDDPLRRALENCNRIRKEMADCKLYSVDDLVVWKAN